LLHLSQPLHLVHIPAVPENIGICGTAVRRLFYRTLPSSQSPYDPHHLQNRGHLVPGSEGGGLAVSVAETTD
jgi:hypothetical protein